MNEDPTKNFKQVAHSVTKIDARHFTYTEAETRPVNPSASPPVASYTLPATSTQPDAVRSLLTWLASPTTTDIKRRNGMEPC